MKIKLKNGTEIECELSEALVLLKEKKTYAPRKNSRTCVICGSVLMGRKTKVCSNPECKRKLHNKYCLNYLRKKRKNGGVPLNTERVPVFIH